MPPSVSFSVTGCEYAPQFSEILGCFCNDECVGFGNAGMLQAADTGSGGRWVVCFLGSLKAVPN